MIVLSDEILYPRQFVECLTGNYYCNCDTFRECLSAIRNSKKSIGMSWRLSDINKVPNDAYIVFVEFSQEWDYTAHTVRIVRIPKKYVENFKINLMEEK